MTTIHFLMKYTDLCLDVIGIIDSYDFNENITKYNEVVELFKFYKQMFTKLTYCYSFPLFYTDFFSMKKFIFSEYKRKIEYKKRIKKEKEQVIIYKNNLKKTLKANNKLIYQKMKCTIPKKTKR